MQRKFSRSPEQLSDIVAFTHDFLDREGKAALKHVLDLCIEELFINMVNYNRETDEDISIELSPHGEGVEVSLTDYGVDRFDPRNIAPVDVDAPLEERTPGGLGLYLVLKMVDAIHYQYRNRTSRITIVVDGK